MKKSLLFSSVAVALATSGIYLANAYSKTSAEQGKSVAMVNQKSINMNKNSKANKYILTVKTEADFSKLYNTIDDLTQNAQIIIVGKVVEASPVIWSPPNTNDSVVYTKEKVSVTKVLRGTLKPGDIVTFVEPGGITTAKSLGLDKKFNLTNEQLNQPVQTVFNETPVMQVNQDVVVFGHAHDDNFKGLLGGEDCYDILGADQGKLEINNGEVHRHISTEMGPNYSSLQMSLEQLENLFK